MTIPTRGCCNKHITTKDYYYIYTTTNPGMLDVQTVITALGVSKGHGSLMCVFLVDRRPFSRGEISNCPPGGRFRLK